MTDFKCEPFEPGWYRNIITPQMSDHFFPGGDRWCSKCLKAALGEIL